MSSFTIHPFDAPLGAEVRGLDCRAPIAAEEAAALRTAFERYHVLVMPANPLTEDEHVNFAACFGVLDHAREYSPVVGRRELMVISNVRQNGELVGKLPDGEVEWHFDKMHQTVPNIAAVLHAIEIPSWGGETLFADTSAAYDALPEATKRRIDGLHIRCAYDYEAPRADARVLTDQTPRAVHPLVRTLASGRKAIFAAPLMTDGIVELSREEGAELLAELYAQIANPQFVYTHRWQVGDTLLWDNRCCAHKRNDFDPAERRLLKRIAINAA